MKQDEEESGLDLDLDLDSLLDSAVNKVSNSTELLSNQVKVYDGPARGRKQCKSCKIYVGIKTNTCNCGVSFRDVNTDNSNQDAIASIYSKVEQAKIDKHVENVALDPDIANYIFGLGIQAKRLLTIYTPAFKCPFSVGAVSFESVKDFCESVIDLGLGQRPAKLYLPSAIKYWLVLNSPEKKQKEVLEFFEQWLVSVKSSKTIDVINSTNTDENNQIFE